MLLNWLPSSGYCWGHIWQQWTVCSHVFTFWWPQLVWGLDKGWGRRVVDNGKDKDKVSAHEGHQMSSAGLGGCVQEMHSWSSANVTRMCCSCWPGCAVLVAITPRPFVIVCVHFVKQSGFEHSVLGTDSSLGGRLWKRSSRKELSSLYFPQWWELRVMRAWERTKHWRRACLSLLCSFLYLLWHRV